MAAAAETADRGVGGSYWSSAEKLLAATSCAVATAAASPPRPPAAVLDIPEPIRRIASDNLN